MVGWYHQLSGHEFDQTLGDSEGQESLACYSPWEDSTWCGAAQPVFHDY